MNSQTCTRESLTRLTGKGIIALAIGAALIGGCSPDKPSPSTTPTQGASAAAAAKKAAARPVGIGSTFRNGAFAVKVTMARAGLRTYTFSAGMAPTKSQNGQLIVVGMTAKNVGMDPSVFGTERHLIVDDKSRRFAPEEVRGFDYHAPINPEASSSGYLIFDVPASVKLRQIVVQTDDNASPANGATLVNVRPEQLLAPAATPRATGTPGATKNPAAPTPEVTKGSSAKPGSTAKPSSSAKPGKGGSTATPGATDAPTTGPIITRNESLGPIGAAASKTATPTTAAAGYAAGPASTPTTATPGSTPTTQPVADSASADRPDPHHPVFYQFRLR